MPLIGSSSTEVVYQDKSLFKAKGAVWHQKDRNAHIQRVYTRFFKEPLPWLGLRVWTSSNCFSRRTPHGLVDTACVSQVTNFEEEISGISWLMPAAPTCNRTEQLAKEGLFS